MTSPAAQSAIAAAMPLWTKTFFVAYGSVWKVGKSGRKTGKAIDQSTLLAFLRDHVPSIRSADLQTQMEIIDHLTALDSESEEETEAFTMEEVDEWVKPMLMIFRWKSNGSAIQGFYHKRLADHVVAGGDFGDAVIREVIPLDIKSEDCLATSLQADPKIWHLYEELYQQAVRDAEVRVTPKSSREGRRHYHSLRGYLRLMREAWLSDMQYNLDNEPKSVANKAETWAYWHFGTHTHPGVFTPTPAATPNWDGWLNKLGHIDRIRAFMAWIFGVCLAKNKSRQVLWIEGGGGDGKGSVMAAISEFIGEQGAGALSDGVFTSEHGSAGIYTKRFLVHPECKNPRILSYALMHSITGADKVLVNPKFGTMLNVDMDAHVTILANCPPDMDAYNFHEASRMLYLYVNARAAGADRSHLVVAEDGTVQLKGDIGFKNRLVEEMPAFLAKCAVCYTELCPSHGNIVLPETLRHDIEDRCASVEQEKFEKFYDDNFQADWDGWIEASTVKEVFDRVMGQGDRKNLGYSSFVKFLESKGHRKIRPSAKDATRVRGFRGLVARGNANPLKLEDFSIHKDHV